MMKMARGRQIAIVLLVGIVGLAVVADMLAYEFDGFTSCRSDHLYLMRTVLQEYAADHGGILPTSIEAIQDELGRYSRCAGSSQFFILLPKESVISDGRILAMCPLGSHGLFRRFGFGLVEGPRGYEIARIGANGSVIERFPMAGSSASSE